MLFAGVLSATTATANDSFYTCEVMGLADTWLDAETADYLLQQYREENFFVSKVTGEVQHLGLGNAAYDTLDLLHSGDAENAFKALSSSDNGWQVHFITVQEYAQGESKRFVIVEGGNVWRGLCK